MIEAVAVSTDAFEDPPFSDRTEDLQRPLPAP
jgi:hypothetical protein